MEPIGGIMLATSTHSMQSINDTDQRAIKNNRVLLSAVFLLTFASSVGC